MASACPVCHEVIPDGGAACPRHPGATLAPRVATYTALRSVEAPTKIVSRDELATQTSKELPAVIIDEPHEPAVKRDPLIGAKLDQYVVASRLGEGGMGVVYRAVQPMIGKEVAIKLLKPEASEDESAVKRLLEEARAVNAIRHRGIIDIFGFGTLDSGQQYVVMELLHGQPLDAHLAAQGRLGVAEAASILDEMLSALGAAHEAGVVHRDLKPNNIFLVSLPGAPRFVKLLDFGLVKRQGPSAERLTRVNMTVGTPQYIAPEQARGQDVTAATDLYAVGVIAFELLSGQLPFDEATPIDWLRAHVTKRPLRLSGLVEVPPAVDEWVARLLSKLPHERPASADEARAELARAVAQRPRPSAPRAARKLAPPGAPPPPQPAERLVISRAAPASSRALGVALGLLAVLAVSATGWWGARSAASSAPDAAPPSAPAAASDERPASAGSAVAAAASDERPASAGSAAAAAASDERPASAGSAAAAAASDERPAVPPPTREPPPKTAVTTPRPAAPRPAARPSLSPLERERGQLLARLHELQATARAAREGKPDELALGVLKNLEAAATAASTSDELATARRKVSQYEQQWLKR